MMDLIERDQPVHADSRGLAKLERVLFLCTRNSARSLMAEELLRRIASDRFEVLSAGLQPGEVHPLTRQVLGEIGIDPSGLRSKGLDKIMGRLGIKYAIVVCQEAEMACPRIYPFAVQTIRWPFEDPASGGNEEELLARFRAVRDSIEWRIRCWLKELEVESVGRPRLTNG